MNSRIPLIVAVIIVLLAGVYIAVGGPGTRVTVTSTLTVTHTYVTTLVVPTTIYIAATSTVTQTVYTMPQGAINAILLEYPREQYPSRVVDLNGDGVPDAVVAVNPWNVKSVKEGGQWMAVVPAAGGSALGGSVIHFVSNLSGVEPADWVNGYPEVYIGRKPWDKSYVNGFGVEFPMRVGELKPFMVEFFVCLAVLDPGLNLNIAADAWIVREEIASQPGRAPGRGDVEIMVWIYSQNLLPAGSKVGEEVLPIVVNGVRRNATFEVWRMDSVPWGGWTYIAFRLRDGQVRCGYVAYDPTQFVRAAQKYLGFDISKHYLLGWEIGTEWGTKNTNGRAVFSWIISGFRAAPGASIK